jgi:hypothetical protein
MSITNLQQTYNKDGQPIGNETTIMAKQIAYITKLREFSDLLNQASQKRCIKRTDIALNNLLNDANDDANWDTITNSIDCPTLKTNVKNAGNALLNNSSLYINNSGAFNKSQTPTTYYNDIITNNAIIEDLRNELDLKLKDLNNTPDSRFREYHDNYNYELAMNITWSILATSILYYVFIKL